jgi:hypothetical protein
VRTILHQIHRLHTAGDVLCAVDCVRALPDYRHRFFVKLGRGVDQRVAATLAALEVPVRHGAVVTGADLTADVASVLYHCIGYDEARPGDYVTFRQKPASVLCCAWIHTPGLCGRQGERYRYLNERGISRLAFSSSFTRANTPELDADRFAASVVIPPSVAADQFGHIVRTDRTFRIGRWSRADNRKYADDFPDLVRSIDLPDVMFECMGIPPKFRGTALPANMRLLESHSVPLEQFIGRLDVLLWKTDAGAWHEGWCRTVTEAMAAGVVPVVERRGGVTDQVIDGYNGYLCTTNAEFKDACESLYHDTALRARLSRNAHHFVRRNFGIARLRERLLALLDLQPGG